MHTMRLPRLAVARKAAAELYAENGIPDRLDGQCFVLLCRGAQYLSETYVDAIVQHALERGVAEIALVGAEPYLIEYAKDAAFRRGVPDVVAKRWAVEVGV